MEQYISKSALVAEIENWIKEASHRYTLSKVQFSLSDRIKSLENLLSFLDILEVKEVDLEKEIKHYFNKQPIITRSKGVDYQLIPSGEKIAKHFFELGLKASNPLTWEDMMTIHKCCKDAMNCNLYEWETAEGQKKIYKDVLKRFKAQKGE